jgi:hypothetical protein
MLMRMLEAYQAVAYSFNRYISPLVTFTGFIFLYIMVSIGLMLDHLFFPSLRRTKVVEPVVIVGNPRSGTTFLHRFLVNNGYGAGMRVWKMIFPSLVMQMLFKPLLPLLEKVSPARHHLKAAHETNLMAIETDDPTFLFRYFDGLFLYAFFLAWAKEDPKEMFDPLIRDTSVRDFNWLDKIWRRNLISEGEQRMVAKMFSLGIRIPHFLQKFPDAKILYLVRDPLNTVPSTLSLVTGVLEGRFGFWNLNEEKRRQYIERLYDAFLDLNLRFYIDYTNGVIPREKVMIVSYDRLMSDFQHLMQDINRFIGAAPADTILKTIKETAEKQKRFTSKHVYDLERFGLNEARIRKDYAVIYKTFLQNESLP